MNARAHTWKACWGQPLRSSNLLSSAASDQAIHEPRSCVRLGLVRLRSLICSLIHSTHMCIKRPKVQAHASECYRGCDRPWGVSALSDQLAAVAATMGERLGSDDAWCSTQICRLFAGSGAWSWVPTLYADLPFMYLFELVAGDLCGTVTRSRATSPVAPISLLGSAGWPGLAPRAAGYQCLRRAKL